LINIAKEELLPGLTEFGSSHDDLNPGIPSNVNNEIKSLKKTIDMHLFKLQTRNTVEMFSLGVGHTWGIWSRLRGVCLGKQIPQTQVCAGLELTTWWFAV